MTSVNRKNTKSPDKEKHPYHEAAAAPLRSVGTDDGIREPQMAPAPADLPELLPDLRALEGKKTAAHGDERRQVLRRNPGSGEGTGRSQGEGLAPRPSRVLAALAEELHVPEPEGPDDLTNGAALFGHAVQQHDLQVGPADRPDHAR